MQALSSISASTRRGWGLLFIAILGMLLFPGMDCGGSDSTPGYVEITRSNVTPWSPTNSDAIVVHADAFDVSSATPGNVEFRLLQMPSQAELASATRAYDAGNAIAVTFPALADGSYLAEMVFVGNEIGTNDPVQDTERIPFVVSSCGDGPYIGDHPTSADVLLRLLTLPSVEVGVPYDVQLPIMGEAPPFIVRLNPSLGPELTTIPFGLTMSTSGRITGTPVDNGNKAPFYIEIQDSCAAGARMQGYGISIRLLETCGNFALSLGTLPNTSGTVGAEFREPITVSGGAGRASLSITGGSGSSDFHIEQNLLGETPTYFLVGIPTSSGTVTIDVLGEDECTPPTTRSQTYSLTIAPGTGCSPALTVPAQVPPAGMVGAPYAYDLTISGGTGDLDVVLSTAAGFDQLPVGLSLDGESISGTPGVAGTTTTRLVVSDSCPSAIGGPQSTTVDLTFVIDPPDCPALGISTAELPNARAGQPYSQSLAAVGGVPGITWSVVPPTSLPSWLTLTTTGQLTGTPPDPTGSPFSFTLRATDNCSTPGPQSAERGFMLTVDPAAPATWDHHDAFDRIGIPGPSSQPANMYDLADEQQVLVLPNGHPVIMATGLPLGGSGYELTVAVANSPTPDSATDWSLFTFSGITLGSQSPASPAAALIDGKLCILFRDPGAGLRYARATVDVPASESDFVISLVDATATENQSPGSRLVDYNGLPVFVTSVSEGGHLTAYLASTAQPDDPDDWSNHAVLTAPGERVARNPQLGISGNRLIAAWLDQTDGLDFSAAAIGVAVAIVDTPAASADWTSYLLNARSSLKTRVGLATIGGVPVVVAGTGDESALDATVHLYRAGSANPLLPGDWADIMVPVPAGAAGSYHTDVIDDGGHALIALSERPGAAGHRIVVARALTITPSGSASDWIIEQVDTVPSYHSSPQLLLAGGRPCVVWPSHFDVDVFLGIRSAAY